MPELLLGKDYPHLCRECQRAVDNAALTLTEFGEIERALYYDDPEAPCNFAYDNAWFCGGHRCKEHDAKRLS